MHKNTGCELCEARKNKGGTYLNVHPWFFELVCRTHNVPMLCLKEHRGELYDIEQREVEKLARQRYGDGRKPREAGVASIRGHWHEHYVEIKT